MLKTIKRWLGWEGHSGFDFEGLEPRRRPTSATASVLSKGPRARSAAPVTPAPPKLPGDDGQTEASRPEPAFDPYNTGKFDRSQSWERISRTQR